jgi:TPR repeat protein
MKNNRENPTTAVGRAGNNRPALAFLYTPRVALPAGEYAFSPSELLDGSGFRWRTSAFRIVKGMPRAQQPAVTAPAQTPAARPQTRTGAVTWTKVQKAAQQGYASAQFELGSAYAAGNGVLQDYVEAHKWLNLAAAPAEGEERSKAAACATRWLHE